MNWNLKRAAAVLGIGRRDSNDSDAPLRLAVFGVLRVSLPLPLTQAQRLALAFRALLREEIKYERKWRRK